MKRTILLQEVRKMRFGQACKGWTAGRLSQHEAAQLPGVCGRSFRRYCSCYGQEGLDGLIDRRLAQVPHRRAPVDEVMAVCERHRSRYQGWSVKHFHAWYRREGGTRSYGRLKSRLQEGGLVARVSGRGKHRKRRERAAWPGMMLHQDAGTHQWVPGCHWDLVVTMDDATNEHYAMFFVEQEGTASSFQGIRDAILNKGLFCSLYTDRGSHYWHTPGAGGKVDKTNLTQVGRASKQPGIGMIPACSPEARGRSERMFATHQARLVEELALFGITGMMTANRDLREHYLPAFNAGFMVPAMEQGPSFVPCVAGQIENILCEHFDRVVGKDNCVSFEGFKLQIPQDRVRMHCVKVKVRVLRALPGRRTGGAARATAAGAVCPRWAALGRGAENGRVTRPVPAAPLACRRLRAAPCATCKPKEQTGQIYLF